MTRRDDLEHVGGLGIAVAKGGAVKSRRLDQVCVGANMQESQNETYLPIYLFTYVNWELSIKFISELSPDAFNWYVLFSRMALLTRY